MVSALHPTEEMITAGIVSVAGRDDLPELTREEVTAIYMAMITALSQQWSEKMSRTKEQIAIDTLAHGQAFPYDATDKWLESIDDEPFGVNAPWNVRAARGVIADLQDRRTIKWGFEEVDEETRAEMVESLAAIILAAHTEKGAQ